MDENKILRIEQVFEFMSKYQLMALATYGEFPWIANLYYAVEPDLRIYFLSDPSRIHCQQIAANPQVSCAVYDSTQTPRKSENFTKSGVQISGVARYLEKDEDVERAVEAWKKALNINSDAYSLQVIKENKIKGRMYEIVPKRIKLFDELLFDEENIPVLEL